MLGFPLFFGALDCRASCINEEISWRAAMLSTGLQSLWQCQVCFRSRLLFPTTDPRVLHAAPAIAKAAMGDRSAANQSKTWQDTSRIWKRPENQRPPADHHTSRAPESFSEGDNEKISAWPDLIEEFILFLSAMKRRSVPQSILVDPNGVSIIDPSTFEKSEEYAQELFRLR
jgi:malate dehydrogenase (oxaloacetate-decarboxylating)(NADP+)